MRAKVISFYGAMLLLLSGCGPRNSPPASPAASSCVDFQTVIPWPQTFPGPTFTFGPLVFRNPTRSGSLIPITLEDRVEDRDGRPELNVGYSKNTGGYTPLIVQFPAGAFPGGVNAASVTLRHFSSATVIAKNSSGGVVSTATQPTQNTRASLALSGGGITALEFDAVESMLYNICWS